MPGSRRAATSAEVPKRWQHCLVLGLYSSGHHQDQQDFSHCDFAIKHDFHQAVRAGDTAYRFPVCSFRMPHLLSLQKTQLIHGLRGRTVSYRLIFNATAEISPSRSTLPDLSRDESSKCSGTRWKLHIPRLFICYL